MGVGTCWHPFKETIITDGGWGVVSCFVWEGERGQGFVFQICSMDLSFDAYKMRYFQMMECQKYQISLKGAYYKCTTLCF